MLSHKILLKGKKTPIPRREYCQQTPFISCHYVTFGMRYKQMVNVNNGIKALCFDVRGFCICILTDGTGESLVSANIVEQFELI